METENIINPMSLDLAKVSRINLDTGNPIDRNIPIPTYNPFIALVDKPTKPGSIKLPEFNLEYSDPKAVAPIIISTKQSQDYINKGFKVTDIDLKDSLQNELSNTQSTTTRVGHNLLNAGANFVSMAVITGFSNPLDLGLTADFGEHTMAKGLFDWSAKVQKDNYNYQTEDDESDSLWENINNWIPGSQLWGVNSTKGLGKLLESVAFGLGAGAGIAAQEFAISAVTGGTGAIPALVAGIQKTLNASKY